ncbi:MAG: hypothetical protein V4439_00470 [Patescibacteria group bacterium]
MIIKNTKKFFKKGFVLLFAMVLSSIVLAIAFGVANIALKEINFSTSAKDTNEAFFASDVGVECALYLGKDPSAFGFTGTDSSKITPSCAGTTLNLSEPGPSWIFSLLALGSEGKSCALVSVFVDTNIIPSKTKIISKGYSNGIIDGNTFTCSPGPNSVERELEVNY